MINKILISDNQVEKAVVSNAYCNLKVKKAFINYIYV